MFYVLCLKINVVIACRCLSLNTPASVSNLHTHTNVGCVCVFAHSGEHKCTQFENPGEGVPDFFAKIPRGVKAFRKNCLGGGSPYFGFYCVFINNLPEGGTIFTLRLPLPHPPCVHLWW